MLCRCERSGLDQARVEDDAALEYVIRRASGRDVPGMANLQDGGAIWSVDAIRAETTDPLATVLVAVPHTHPPDARPTPLGWVCAWDIVAERQLDVMMLGVAPGARRRGVATALLRALCDRHPRALTLTLDVSAANAGARALYAALGAVELGRRPRYYADGSDALVLHLDCNALKAGACTKRGTS